MRATLSPAVVDFPLVRRKKAKSIVIRQGSVTVRIYKTKWHDKKRRRVYQSHVIVYRDGLGEHREKFADIDEATTRANDIARDIANGQAQLSSVTPEDWASYRRSCELSFSTGQALESVAADYAQAIAKIREGRDPKDYPALSEVVDFYNRHHPVGTRTVTIPDAVTEMKAARKADGASQNTLDDYESRLGRFSDDFQGPIFSVTGADINTWLRGLGVSNRTRNNYRGNLVDFYRFVKQMGYVPKTWDVMSDVPRVKNEPVKIEIFTPEEITALLGARRTIETRLAQRGKAFKTLIPYIAIAAFAGPRHEEMCAGLGPNKKPLPVLDWRQVDFEKKEIQVLPEVARKIGHDRLVPMTDNLIDWIKPYVKTNGPICEIANVTGALARAAAEAGIRWKDNGLRKSFISYRLALTHNIGTVAQEAGTSPDRIRHNYKKTVPEREAVRWFGIAPTTADVIQLNLGLK